MQIIYKQGGGDYQRYYDDFFLECRLSFSYHPLLLQYHSLIASPSIDASFVVVENNKCVGVCYCPIYEIQGKRHISNNGGYTIAPFAINERIYKEIFQNLERIAKQYQCATIKLFLDSSSFLCFQENDTNTLNGRDAGICFSPHILLLKKFGFIDTSSVEIIYNLSLENSILWTNLSKKYKTYINHAKQNDQFQIKIITKDNPSKEMHDLYVHFHHLCSRRKTRSDESFEIQYTMLLEGYATLFCLFHENRPLSFYYCFHCHGIVSAGSASDNPDYEHSKMPVYHFLLWNILLHFKDKNYKYLAIGQPSNFHIIQGFNDYCDDKQTNIATYKRGMGGATIPLQRGIKYFDSDLFQEDLKCFDANFNLDFHNKRSDNDF